MFQGVRVFDPRPLFYGCHPEVRAAFVPKTPHGSMWRPGEGASPQPTSAVKARKGAQAREARPCPGFSKLSVRGQVGEGEASLPSPARPMLPLPHQPLKLLYQFRKISQRLGQILRHIIDG